MFIRKIPDYKQEFTAFKQIQTHIQPLSTMTSIFDTIRGQTFIKRPLRSLLLIEKNMSMMTPSPPVSAPSTPIHRSNDHLVTEDSIFTITPISSNPKNKANRDYLEQLDRIEEGKPLVWDDSKFNKSRPGDIFGFWMHKKKVKVHFIKKVSPPSERLPSWHKNVGQSDRNVIELSDEYFEVDWETWISIGGAKRCMGTAPAKKSLSKILEISKNKF